MIGGKFASQSDRVQAQNSKKGGKEDANGSKTLCPNRNVVFFFADSLDGIKISDAEAKRSLNHLLNDDISYNFVSGDMISLEDLGWGV